jgi:hypothetical protein
MGVRQDSCGSAALLYPGLIAFVFLFAALVFDTLIDVGHERVLTQHTEAFGRDALMRFDQDIYRQNGTIIAALTPSGADWPASAVLGQTDCTSQAAVNQVTVVCTSVRPRGLLFGRQTVQVTVRRTVRAELVCASCGTFDDNAG